jgi:hypothetical protein
LQAFKISDLRCSLSYKDKTDDIQQNFMELGYNDYGDDESNDEVMMRNYTIRFNHSMRKRDNFLRNWRTVKQSRPVASTKT